VRRSRSGSPRSCSAHIKEADAVDELSEARGIFHAAQSFADEFGAADPGFDSERFIKDATRDRS